MANNYRFRPLNYYSTFGNALAALRRIADTKGYVLRGRVKFMDNRGWFTYRRFNHSNGGRWQQLTMQEGPYRLQYLEGRDELLNVDNEVLVVAGHNGSIPSAFNMRIPKTIRNGTKQDGNTKNAGGYYP